MSSRTIEQRFSDVANERDIFRLVIRGYTLIDELLDEAINGAFSDGRPRELNRLRLSARLALAQALRVMPPEVCRAIDALATSSTR
jgi:hypothetical protein